MKLTKTSTLIISSLLLANTTFAAQTQINPQEGYTQAQRLELSKQFDYATYNDGSADVARFTYLNMPQFFNHQTINRTGEVSNFPVNDAEPLGEIGAIKVETSLGEMTLEQWTEKALDSVIVVYKGEIIYEKYPRMQENDKHVWWSVSKSIAGSLVAQLESEGKVDIRKPVETYIQELKATEWEGVLVRDVLHMQSGMSGLEADDPEAYTNPESPYGQFEASLGVQPKTENTLDSTYEYIKTLKRLRTPGTKHEYTSVDTFVMAWLLEAVTGKSYADLVEERIWSNIGAEQDALIVSSQTGAPGAHGLISSTLRDVARYGMLFTPSWNKVSETKVFSDQAINNMQNDADDKAMKAGIGYEYFNGYALGDIESTAYQWDYITQDKDIAKSGFGGQTLYISPSKDLVVVSFATQQTYDTFKFARMIAKSIK